MDFYQRAKRYSIEKFTSSALSLLANASSENLIRLTYLAEKIPQRESYREKIRWIRTLFQPCLLIDHPQQGREFALQHAKYFTHEGAEQLFIDFAQAIDRYAKAYGEIAEAAWKEKIESRSPQPLSAGKKVVGRHG